MSGSGIGRGRGWLNINKGQCQKPGIPPQTTLNYDYNCVNTPTGASKMNPKYTAIINKFSLFNENDDGIMLNKKLKSIVEEFNKACQTPTDVEEAFEGIYEKCLNDEEFASKAIGVISAASFNTLAIREVKLRTLFLTQFQKDFEDRKQLQKNNPNMFRNRVKMIGDFLHKARLPDGRPMAILTPAVLQYLDMLLDSTNEQDLQLFTTQIFTNGYVLKKESPENLIKIITKLRKLLGNSNELSTEAKFWLMLSLEFSNNKFSLLPPEIYKFYIKVLGENSIFMNGNIIKEESPEQLTETLIQVRKILATSDKLSTNCKYWLMMSIEISNSRYGLLPNDVNQFYVTHLGDKAMSQIKKLNTELSILTNYQNMKLDSVESNVSVLQPVTNTQNWEAEDKQNRAQQSYNNMASTWEQPKQEKTPRPILGVGARLKHEKNDDTNWREQKTDNDAWDNSKKPGKNWNPNNKQRKNPKGWEHDDRLENDYN